MLAAPALTPRTTPVPSTVATAASLEVNWGVIPVTGWPAPSRASTFRIMVSPTGTAPSGCEIVTDASASGVCGPPPVTGAAPPPPHAAVAAAASAAAIIHFICIRAPCAAGADRPRGADGTARRRAGSFGNTGTASPRTPKTASIPLQEGGLERFDGRGTFDPQV